MPIPVRLTILLGCAVLPTLRAQSLNDYEPQVREVVLNTDVTQITPKSGPPYTVTGGVFVFRNVKISAGVTVRGTGSRPMLWLVTGDFQLDGELTVRGENAPHVDTLNSANFPSPGGRGNCSGGNGGAGSVSPVGPDPTGQPGFGSGQYPAAGGAGGLMSCNPNCGRGSGGGGGAYATQGDPWYPTKSSGTSFLQQLGSGGPGCLGASGSASRTLPGGNAGARPFTDNIPGNDFFGLAYDVFRNRLIAGELGGLHGGTGGGGGGDRSVAHLCPPLANPNWILDNKGAGGGGGGGVVVICALGRILIGATGRLDADGGDGGGGEPAGSNNQGGGGGGGSGGMVILWSQTHVEVATHGETFANRDYSFAISADGGICRQGAFGGTLIAAKYPPPPGGALWDATPTGGMGGLGVVQFITLPGTNADGTNTVLDDNIHIVQNNVRLVGAHKQRYLAWRGFPDAQGAWVDDLGNPTNIGDREGDIRPTPILLPLLK